MKTNQTYTKIPRKDLMNALEHWDSIFEQHRINIQSALDPVPTVKLLATITASIEQFAHDRSLEYLSIALEEALPDQSTRQDFFRKLFEFDCNLLNFLVNNVQTFKYVSRFSYGNPPPVKAVLRINTMRKEILAILDQNRINGKSLFIQSMELVDRLQDEFIIWPVDCVDAETISHQMIITRNAEPIHVGD